MDRNLRCEIAQVFASESVHYHYEVMNEVWLTAAKLSEQIQFFSKSWLEDYGHLLPREHVQYEDEHGVVHKTSWCYPLHRIQRMIVEDKLYFHVDSLKGEKKKAT